VSKLNSKNIYYCTHFVTYLIKNGLSHEHNCMVTLQLNLGQPFPQFSSPTSTGIYITGWMPFLSPSHRYHGNILQDINYLTHFVTYLLLSRLHRFIEWWPTKRVCTVSWLHMPNRTAKR